MRKLNVCRPRRLRRVAALAAAVLVFSAMEAAPSHPAVVSSEFIYDVGPYPSCHASTVVETKEGSLLAAWFGGTAESQPDVCIYLSRFEEGRWTTGVQVADGVQHDAKRYPCWNPVLFQSAEGPLLLFYKVGPFPAGWWGMMMSSDDEGRTWSVPRRLPEDVLGPIKNKPVQLADGTLVCGSSTESAERGWEAQVELTPDLGKTWSVIGPLNDTGQFNAIQPAFLVHADGRLQMLCRTMEWTLATSFSGDAGLTWTPMVSSGLYGPNSGVDAVTLRDGRHLVVYNSREQAPVWSRDPRTRMPMPEDGKDWDSRHPLDVAVSVDGMAWRTVITLEDEPRKFGYAYPAIIQARDGLVHVTYTWNREKIKHVVLDPSML